MLNGAPTTSQVPGKHASVQHIPLEGRRVRAAHLFCDTARHTEPTRAYPNGQLTMHTFLQEEPTAMDAEREHREPSQSMTRLPLPRHHQQTTCADETANKLGRQPSGQTPSLWSWRCPSAM